MKKKISIIIPVYNVENYLRQCIESILEQEYEEKEIILVDDGSTDNSGSICDEYADKYENVLVIHKENGGLSDARNVGLAKAAGEYVLFVDSDDFVEENSLSPIVEIVNANPVDVVLLEAQKYYADGTNIPMCDGISKEMVYKKAKKDTVIEEIILPNAIVKDIPSVATLTVRFGYTSVTFDINLIVR